MARKTSRPGRSLIIFGLVVVAMYIGLAINGNWKPALGLDLQGGTSITLTASTETGESITPEKLREAADIIDNRVNASGVSESEVTTQGSDTIVVEVPGPRQASLVDTVKQTAQLRFRVVAAAAADEPAPEPSPSTSPSTSEPADGKKSDSKKKDEEKTNKGGDVVDPAGRAVSKGLLLADGVKANGSSEDTAGPSVAPSGDPSEAPVEESTPAEQPAAESAPVPNKDSSIEEILAWIRSPDAKSIKAFTEFSCDQEDVDNPNKVLLACDDSGSKYLLSPAIIEGTQLNDAGYGIPQNDVQYVVNLDFDGDATETFAEVTRAIVGTGERFAIVLDGEVLSAPVVNNAIIDGNAQISGDFNQASAESLANSLKYGALPLKFEDSVVSEEGPTLAADQLSAGLWAGGFGLALVLIYCMLYYRGLGIVVVASLAIAGAVTYAAVLFLSATAGFTLTLPGIAGLIVAVGITADSFIVYFERIRDEMRDGKSLRVAVEAGWIRARATCVAADAVSLLAAAVLYTFAIGVVKGFAFALGISTLIDLVVFFLFTKPMVTWLARFKFFSSGNKFSGLSAGSVGAPLPTTAQPVGGIAR